ncbi:hypothetical protein A9Q84_10455 [Halobacteriovorax marinus]|uniref:S-adenosylmethionine-dependent methyltransferase domain-containing protein n=1 Tax=Halobacteriovorax marinus TaxID=97084 RepID=A0A1Y5F778_9BACT|nr:hypothetical protein A9Q84_10455 [Halobacteriovorax marinus]
MNDFLEFFQKQYDEANDNGECRRIFHGRGQLFSGLDFFNIDLYHPVVFISLFKTTPFEGILKEVIDIIGKNTPLVVQSRVDGKISREFYGDELPHPHVVCENGLKYLVDLSSNQNTGLFLDMKEGRSWLRAIAKEKDILNLFSYTCSLSVAAKAGGANKVVNIDQKKSFLSIGRENHRLNDLDESITYRNWDALKSMNQIGRYGPFDLIFCDPPSNQGKSFFYKRDYKKLIRKGGRLLKENGLFVACLNTPFESIEFLKTLFSEDEGQWRLLEVMYSSADFQEADCEQGLKITVFKRINDL